MARRILIVSASMGAGHDGAAHELRTRLERHGHVVRVVDFLDCCPFGIGWFIKWTYMLQLRIAPWSYELTYRLWYKMPSTWGFIVRLDTLIAGRRMRKAIDAVDADVVVSTYPLSSLVLGNMRKKRWLRVPVVTYLTDFAVHPLWVHPHVDVHLATSPFAARTARDRGGDDSRAPGPMVADRFTAADAGARAAVRDELGLGDGDRAVLVVAGSWGVGDVPGTVDAILDAGAFHPVVVCGRDDALRARLSDRPRSTVLGWRDDMPRLMAGCDVMVENAGGLTANEAFASGLPVVTFLPIAGHGKDNAEGMAALGVTSYARSPAELREALETLTRPGPDRVAQTERARELFASDPTDDVVHVAARREARAIERPIQMPRTPHRVRVAATGLLAAYVLLTLGGQGVAAMGIGLAEPPATVHRQVYVGVRLTAAELSSAEIRSRLDRMGATAIVDAQAVRDAGPAPMRSLVAGDVDVGNGGWGKGRPFRYLRAQTDVQRATDAMTAVAPLRVREFVPGRRLDAFDQLFARRKGQRLVEPDQVVGVTEVPRELRDRAVYMIDGRDARVGALAVALDDFERSVSRSDVSVAPLSELR